MPKLCLPHCTVRANQIAVHIISDVIACVKPHTAINMEKSSSWIERGIITAAELSAKGLGYFQLKLEQQQAISTFVEGQDVFVSEFVTYGVREVFLSSPFQRNQARSQGGFVGFGRTPLFRL